VPGPHGQIINHVAIRNDVATLSLEDERRKFAASLFNALAGWAKKSYWAKIIALSVKNPILDPTQLVEDHSELFLAEVVGDILREFPLWEPPEVDGPKKSLEKKSTIDALERFFCWVAFWLHTPVGVLLEDTMTNIQAMASNLGKFKDEYFTALQAATHGVYNATGGVEENKGDAFSKRMSSLQSQGAVLLERLDKRGS
jgi:hypothetical protein